MKLALVLCAAAAAVSMQFAAASVEIEEKELEHALAARETGVEKRHESWEDEEEIAFNALSEIIQSMLRYMRKQLRRRKSNGKGGRISPYTLITMPGKSGQGNGQGRRRKGGRKQRRRRPVGRVGRNYPYTHNTMPRGLKEGEGDGKQQDAVALCKEFLSTQKIRDAAKKFQNDDNMQMEDKQNDDQEENDVDPKEQLKTVEMLEFCLDQMA